MSDIIPPSELTEEERAARRARRREAAYRIGLAMSGVQDECLAAAFMGWEAVFGPSSPQPSRLTPIKLRLSRKQLRKLRAGKR